MAVEWYEILGYTTGIVGTTIFSMNHYTYTLVNKKLKKLEKENRLTKEKLDQLESMNKVLFSTKVEKIIYGLGPEYAANMYRRKLNIYK